MNNIYPNIAAFSSNFLMLCVQQDIYNNDIGKILLSQIESYLAGNDIKDKDFQEAIKCWRNGSFCYGYYVNDNDTEFVHYLRKKIYKRF